MTLSRSTFIPRPLLAAALLVFVAAPLWAAETRELRSGDGREFEARFNDDGLPLRADNDEVAWESVGFRMNLDGDRPVVSDEFVLVLKGKPLPSSIRIVDASGPEPVLLLEDADPTARLEDAGIRKMRWHGSQACTVTRDADCSAWMFDDDVQRIYRVELSYPDGERSELHQVEVYDVTALIGRLFPTVAGQTE